MKKLSLVLYGLIAGMYVIVFPGCHKSNLILTKNLEELKADVQADPNNEEGLYNLGLGFYYNEDYPQAAEAFTKAVNMNEHYGQAYFGLYCASFLSDSRFKEKFYENDLSSADKAVIDSLNKYFEMAVTCSPFFRWTIALNLLPEKAEAGIIKGDLTHNRDYGQQELAKVRNNMFFDGFQNIFAGEYEKALSIFNYLIEDVPTTVEEQWMLDSAAAANGITDEKYAKDYKIAVRFYRAITLLSMGNYSMAALDFSAVADRFKDVNDARMLPLTLKEGYAEFLTGACYYELSMYNKAEEAFKKALLRNPALYMAHYRLSQIYSQQKKYDMALSELSSALTIKPDDSILHYNKGYFLSLRNKKEEALSEFEIAAGFNAHNLRAIYGSAEFFENMGKNDKASEKYLLFINNAPQRDSIKIAEARLKLHSLKTK